MGQRLTLSRKDSPADRFESARGGGFRLCGFPTQLGWFGLWGASSEVDGLTIGHDSAGQVREAAFRSIFGATDRGLAPEASRWRLEEADWLPQLRRRLEDYARGRRVEFQEFAIDVSGRTSFQTRVLELTRRLPYGRTISYGDLAAQAGAAGAARAVGQVMASNRVPILIPCHRVIGAHGALGGFSAPSGLNLKRRLLELESAVPDDPRARVKPRGKTQAKSRRILAAARDL